MLPGTPCLPFAAKALNSVLTKKKSPRATFFISSPQSKNHCSLSPLPARVQVTVSGGAPAKTKAKSMYGNRSSMQPVWRTQLWVPVSIPCMSGSVKTIVKDWDSVGDDEVRCGTVGGG